MVFFSSFRPVQAHCRSPTGRSFNRFKRSASMTGLSHAACNIGCDLDFRLDRYRDAALLYYCSEDLPLNCCNCSAAGRAQSLGWVRRQLDLPATFPLLLSQNVQLSTNDGAFARRVSSATCTTGERSLQPPNPSSSPAPTCLTFGSKKIRQRQRKTAKRKIEDNSNCSQPLACAQASHRYPVFKHSGKGRLSAHPDGTISVLDQTSAIFSLHIRAAGRGPYISYGRNLQTCLKFAEYLFRFVWWPTLKVTRF